MCIPFILLVNCTTVQNKSVNLHIYTHATIYCNYDVESLVAVPFTTPQRTSADKFDSLGIPCFITQARRLSHGLHRHTCL